MSKKILFFTLTPLALALLTIASMYLWQARLTSGQKANLESPSITPRAQSEFESGALIKQYREASLKELETEPSIDTVFNWISAHPEEAKK